MTLYQYEIDSQAQDNSYWPWQADYHRSTKIVEIKPGFKIRGSFCALFAGSEAVKHYIGLKNFDTSQGKGFQLMLNHMSALQDLNLSSWDLRQAQNTDGLFKNNYQLWKLTLGAAFRFPTNPEIAPAEKTPLPDNANLINTDPRW